jgi:CheY-like chemotaxis protein
MELGLPRSHEEVEAAEKRAPAAEPPSLEDADLPSILLVDDSAALRELTAEALRQRGFEVTAAGGGAEALAIIEREPEKFDLIVTDFAMPLVSGLDVIRFARNLRTDWPAIIITGYADEGAIADRPADVPLLSKPFAENDLVRAIMAAGTSVAETPKRASA